MTETALPPAPAAVAVAVPAPETPAIETPPRRRPVAAKVATFACIASVIVVVIWQMDPQLLLATTTTTGGDTGAHFGLAAYLKSNLLPHMHLTGWFPGAYDGQPLYTFYFPFSDLVAAVLGYVIPFTIAFKMTTILGSVLLPVSIWAFARLAGLERPRPAVLALAALPFLFDQSYTIYGGNLYSTLAGEYAFSLSLSLAILLLGVVARGLRTGQYRAWAAVLTAVCVLTHLVPAMFAFAGIAVLFLMAPPSRRRLWWVISAIGTGSLLVGFWALPFATEQAYTTNMGWLNVTSYAQLLAPGGNRWALALAAVGLVVALVLRVRPMILFGVLGVAAALCVVYEPQGKLYNTRFLPLWWICVYILAAYAVAEGGVLVAKAGRRLRAEVWAGNPAWVGAPSWTGPGSAGAPDWAGRSGESAVAPGLPDWGGTTGDSALPTGTLATATVDGYGPLPPRREAWPPGAVTVPLAALAAALAFVLPPLLVGPAANITIGPLHIRPSNVSSWAQWNYSGVERKPAWPEMQGVISTVDRVAAQNGCGRAMWEYNSSLVRFGTPMAPMLLPYWTDGCIDSMEGLLFESASSTPFHFLNQAEMSAQPSEAVVASTTGIRYGPLDVALGVQHLRLMGVKYFLAFSPSVQAQADQDPGLRFVAATGPWRSLYNGVVYNTTWKIYVVRGVSQVSPLTVQPSVVSGLAPSQPSWLPVAQNWYVDSTRWDRQLVAGGPTSWSRVSVRSAASGHGLGQAVPLPAVTVSDVRVGPDSVQFHVDRTGVPVLVRTSYFPAWQATGATGPWRAMPNLMVVVPTAHDVTLHYGSTPSNRLGLLLTAIGVVALVILVLRRHERLTAP